MWLHGKAKSQASAFVVVVVIETERGYSASYSVGVVAASIVKWNITHVVWSWYKFGTPLCHISAHVVETQLVGCLGSNRMRMVVAVFVKPRHDLDIVASGIGET